ncbi:unnamed protein product [Peronospora belbahrii]|uniref:EF-hand domain-containing protein n=1 Tax=Peronospora belbahrii TaxID=622444 RepID=A0AAU9LAP1_9STRA|nr:unnamed protein product [Peronospora belbahrii]
MFNSISGSSHNFPEAQQQIVDLTGSASSSTVMAPCIVTAPSQAMFVTDPGMPFNASSVMPVSIAPNDYAPSGGIPYDYFSPSGYAAAANQSLESYQQQVQPFVMQPDAALFHGQQAETNDTNVQIAAAVAMANSADINTMHRMNGNYGVSIAPLQHRAGSMFSTAQVNVAGPLKLPLPAQRANCATSASAFTSNKGSRFAITPDIADFKLVQIFYQFCDPATKVLTLPRFQQLLLYHQIKDKTLSKSDSAADVTSDLQTLFRALDIKNVGSLDLERFMSSFQICNRCTEVKRRAHQALCASQGQTFTSTALERQLMEDVAPVIVRVVPTCYEGPKVKSCEHYQWTWCEGYDKTGNDKCRGTNRHDKCPKYLANCTLWKHKLPPKNRKPRVLLENVDSPTKKFKHFS